MIQIIFLIEKYLKLQNQKLVNVYFPKIILNGFYVSNFILKKNKFCQLLSMTYYAKPNFIEYDDWFDENIDPLDLNYYFDESCSLCI